MRSSCRSLLFLPLVTCWPFFQARVLAQSSNIGTPFITNYPATLYEGGTQHYAICQDAHWMTFFASEKGMLEFDGHTWRRTPVASKTKVRSLLPTQDGRIYAGAQGEIGYFLSDPHSGMRYVSLTNSIPAKARDFADVWSIVPNGNSLCFRTDNRIFLYDGNSFQVISSPGTTLFDFLGTINGSLYLNRSDTGLCRFANGAQTPIPGGKVLASCRVMAMLELTPGRILIATFRNGFFLLDQGQVKPWQTPCDAFIRRHWISTAVHLPDGLVALGTHDNGVLVIDPTGNPIHHFSRKNGLQNNAVLSLLCDHAGSLWVGLARGIDQINYSMPFQHLSPDRENAGVGYASLLSNGKLYFAMNDGVWYKNWKEKYSPLETDSYRLVAGTGGQSWQLMEVNQTLFLGHHDGTFLIRGEAATRISTTQGSWGVMALNGYPDVLLCGTYVGLGRIRRQGDGWQQSPQLPGFAESSRVMEQDGAGNIWITHDYKGAYRVKLSADMQQIDEIKHYNHINGFPSDLDINVFKINGELVFTSESGVFRFNPHTDRFEPYTVLTQLLGPGRIRRLIEDPYSNIWFVRNNEVGYLKRSPGTPGGYRPILIPELRGMVVENFEHIYPLDSQNIFIATTQGFVHFDPSYDHKTNLPMPLQVRGVSYIGEHDSLLFAGGEILAEKPRYEAYMRALRFAYAVPGQPAGAAIQYSYYLEGLEKTWSPWTDKPVKEYTNLPHGSFVFHVRARNLQGEISAASNFAFQIITPWYFTWLAKLVYVLLLLAAFGGVLVFNRRRHEREKRYLTLRQQRDLQLQQQSFRLEAEHAEKEILRLRNEQLQAEIAHKNRELASSAMHLVQKGTILTDLKEALRQVSKATDETPVKSEVKRIIHKIDQDLTLDENWNQFAIHFDQVHSDFLKMLKDRHPIIKGNDLRLCIYLRMGLSTKEIAGLMNISVRGMEISRYRLRKKLGLVHEENLSDYLSGLGA